MKNLKTKLKKWLALKTEDCKTVAPLFSYALDRRLTLREKLRVRLHLFSCGACLNYVSNLRFMHEIWSRREGNFENEKIHAALSEESKERIKAAVKASE